MPHDESLSHHLESGRSAAIVQLIVLIAVFVAAPLLIYGLMRALEMERETARFQIVETRASLMADGLTPVLEAATPAEAEALAGHLARFQSDDAAVKLFFRPPAAADSSGVFFIASSAPLGAEALRAETARLQKAGLITYLTRTCAESGPRPPAITAEGDTLTAAVRVRSPYGCWGIVGDFVAPAAAPLWSQRVFQIMAAGYAGLVLIALTSAIRLMIALGRARRAAQGDVLPCRVEPMMMLVAPPSLAQDNVPQPPETVAAEAPPPQAMPQPEPAPELATPAETPPELVQELVQEPPLAAAQAADDSFTPEVDPLAGGARSELLDPAREVINLSTIVADYLRQETGRLGASAARLQSQVERGIVMRGRADFVRTILGEIIGGAVKDGGEVRVALSTTMDENRRRALLSIVQSGGHLPELGRLPLIKQFVSALGAVSAETRDGATAVIRVAFPA